MDRWDKPAREDRHGRRRENPSFSSTLLDAIYRSIDEGHGEEREEELVLYRESSVRKKQSSGLKEQEEEMASFRRACMIEKWMDKKVNDKVVVRRSSAADFDRKSRNDRGFDHLLQKYSSSSSSESSSGGGFSSSESSESVYTLKSRSSCYGMQRPKPIRTSFSGQNPQPEKPKHENSFVKTKSRALKIYGDLKKVKQPISPGGRLASFLNSLFTAGSPKKAKTTSSSSSSDETGSERKSSKSTATSTCTSASSFSRSCLSNTPSSRGKFSNGGGVKRSVRFCPRVSVIVDEDCRPKDAEIKCYVMGGNYRVDEVTKDLFRNYQKEIIKEDLDMKDVLEDEDDDDDDDAGSCSSSDLFELDNLSAVGIERYRQELPVYETTHFDTNRAIANGLIL
ncbi:protein BIG GRAIN 1-like A [Corylus avellana]|uniref:protein BIG GRAIN 1-like A n=1 Tax=Corylus avellana TaxID=13451 RepID=UPI001E226F76|nr:protein BIG GRAIN 1-like A [Corylus avellana]